MLPQTRKKRDGLTTTPAPAPPPPLCPAATPVMNISSHHSHPHTPPTHTHVVTRDGSLSPPRTPTVNACWGATTLGNRARPPLCSRCLRVPLGLTSTLTQPNDTHTNTHTNTHTQTHTHTHPSPFAPFFILFPPPHKGRLFFAGDYCVRLAKGGERCTSLQRWCLAEWYLAEVRVRVCV